MALRRSTIVGLAGLAAGLGCGGTGTGISGVLVVADVVVTPSPATLIVGGSIQLLAESRTASGIPVPGRPVVWSVTGNTAMVSPSGIVTAQAVGGPVQVRAVVDGVMGEALVTVSDRPVTSVRVTPNPASVIVGQSQQLTAQAYDANGALLTGRTFSWQSNAPATVDVTTTGIVLGQVAGGPVTITAISEGVSGTASVTAVAAPAARLEFTGQSPGGIAGQALVPAVRVTIQNQAGGTVTTATGPVTITLASNPGGATLGGTVTVNAMAGVAIFPNLRIDRAGSGYRLEATAATLAPAVSSAFAITPAVPFRLAFVTAPPASAQSGIPLLPAPAVQVLDIDDAAVRQAGITMAVTLQSGGGTLTGAPTATTDANGLATLGPLTLTGTAGTRTLLFSTGTIQLTSGPIALGAGSASQLVISVQPPGTAASGQAFSQQPAVQLRDASNNPVGQAGVNVTVAIASGGGTLGGTATVATNGSGTAVFSGLSISGATGNRTLGFQAPGFAAVTSNAIALAAGPAAELRVTTQPSATAASGQPLPQQPVVQLRDAADNPVSQAGVAVTAAIGSGGGTLGGTATVATNGSGTAVFSGLSISGTVGSRILSFQAAGLPAMTSNAIAVTAGAAAKVTITTQPPFAAGTGQVFVPQPVVQLRDAADNSVSQAGVAVTAAIASGGGTLGGTATVATNTAGAAAFSGLAIFGAAGSRTLSFQATGLASALSNAIEVTISAASGTQLTITTQPPASAIDAAAFSPQPAVQLRDALGNPVPVAGVVVTAALATGAGTLGGILTASTNAGGLATFSDLKITGPLGVRTLGFSAPSVPAVVSTPVTLTIGPATQLGITTQPPASAVNGTAFSPQPAVQVLDAGGNPVSGAGVVVTAAIATGGVALGGTLTASTNAGGLATFTTLRITGTVGARTLSFSAPTLTPVSSTPVTITAGTATQLSLTTQPSTTAASGQAFAQQPVVQLRDASGNAVSLAGVTVTVSIASGGGTLGVTTTAQTNATGAAVFSGVAITGTVGSRTLSFQATGVTAVTSTAIALAAGAPTQITVTTQPSAAAVNDVAFSQQPAVQVRDASGNPVAAGGVVVSVGIATGGGVLGGITTATTTSSGLATFSGLKITGTIGARTLSFTAAGYPAVASTAVTVSAGAATQLTITTQPSATVKTGAQLAQQPVIQLRDGSGNAAAQSGVAVVATVASGPGVLSGTMSVTTNGSGTATFTNLRVTGVGTTTLRFSSGVLLAAVSTAINVTP